MMTSPLWSDLSAAAPGVGPMPLPPISPLPAHGEIVSPTPATSVSTAVVPRPPAEIAPPPEPDYTDAQLMEALAPFIEQALRNVSHRREMAIESYLDPMLRATVRRTLAGSTSGSRPYRPPGLLDRVAWFFQALFGSRTYGEIVAGNTRRFQIGEVFLLDAATFGLVSFASADPARHATAGATARRLAAELRDKSGQIRRAFDLPDHGGVIACAGQCVILIAVCRGHASDPVIADLEFALQRIEDRFRGDFQQPGTGFAVALQPYLEDCLLIQAAA